MNKTIIAAQKRYAKTKQAIDAGMIHNTEELAKLVKEQERLQVFIRSGENKSISV